MITSNPDVQGGDPCLEGRRFTVAQALAEIADSGIDEFCEDFDISKEEVVSMLRHLSLKVNEIKFP